MHLCDWLLKIGNKITVEYFQPYLSTKDRTILAETAGLYPSQVEPHVNGVSVQQIHLDALLKHMMCPTVTFLI